MEHDGADLDERLGERDLEVLLSYLLNRQLTQTEVIEALGVSRSTYYDLKKNRNRLISPENLVTVAKSFGVNPIELLARYGHITHEEVCDFYDHYIEVSEHRTNFPLTTIRGGKIRSHHLGPGI